MRQTASDVRSRRSRDLWLVGAWLAAAYGCSLPARFAQTAIEGEGSAGAPAAAAIDASVPVEPAVPIAGRAPPSIVVQAPQSPAACPATLAERLTTTTIELEADIRYKAAGHEGFPMDERIAFSVAPSGRAYVGWIENATGRVRVTPLDEGLTRDGPDVLVDGDDIGGLIAHEDGFALLTRRADPGEMLRDPTDGSPAKAAALVRYREGRELFSVPLTGTDSITREAEPRARDCAAGFLYGRLGWNGSKYGAYFLVRGCGGDPHGTSSGDKMVYADAAGAFLPGGWSFSCTDNQGLRLWPERDSFTSVCFSASSRFAGLNLVTDGRPALPLGAELIANGYVTGQFGSLVKLGDGSYIVGWQSRGVGDARAGSLRIKKATDIALIRLDAERAPLSDKQWLFETSDSAESNLHFANYGPDRVLVVWDTLQEPECSYAMCFGKYGGTLAGLIDHDGQLLSPPALLSAVPNTGEDIMVFPNGDLGWAYVAEAERHTAAPLPVTRSGELRVPVKRELSVARLRYCE